MFLDILDLVKSRDSAVDIAIGYGLDYERGRSFSPDGVKILHVVQIGSGVHPLSAGVKRPDCEFDLSPQIIAEVKKMWIYIYIYTALYVFIE
jgi:hypothetical protein